MSLDTWPVAASTGAYGLFLQAYPRDFREGYAGETVQVFREDCRHNYAAGGAGALLGLWARTIPDVLRSAMAEHLSDWLADHPGRRRSARHQFLVALGLTLGIVAIFFADTSTPPEVPLAIMYACVLFAAGTLLRPELGSLICAATLGVYVVDGWFSVNGWTLYRAAGLVALLVAGLWALRTGADHARLRARAPAARRHITPSEVLPADVPRG
jgi:hypothetical protein